MEYFFFLLLKKVTKQTHIKVYLFYFNKYFLEIDNLNKVIIDT